MTGIKESKNSYFDKNLKIFPIGTSRLHEPLSLINKEEVIFPGVGYFHTSSQVVDWIKILRGEKILDENLSKFFYRKDQTPPNLFDLNLWKSEKFEETLKKKQILFNEANTLIIEISTIKSYIYNDININGNPNFKHNLTYAEAWGENGYYEKMHPDMNVKRYSDVDNIYNNLEYINNFLINTEKYSILLGHLIDPNEPNTVRLNHNKLLLKAIEKLKKPHIFFFDTSHLVEEFGFRILENGTTDIHHLPWEGLKKQAGEMYELLVFKKNNISLDDNKGGDNKTFFLSLGENCLADNILQRHNLKSFSTPYSHGRGNLDYAIHCEKENYTNLINTDNLVYEHRYNKDMVINTFFPKIDQIYVSAHAKGFEFTHHDIIASSEYFNSFQRKVDRLLLIRGKSQVIFFYHYRKSVCMNNEKIIKKAVEFINNYYPKRTNSKICVFAQNIVEEIGNRKLIYKKISDSVHHFVFDTQNIWGGKIEDDFWAKNDDDLIKEMIEIINN